MSKLGFYIVIGFFSLVIIIYFINFFNFFDEAYRLDNNFATKCISEVCFYEDLVTYKCYSFKQKNLIQIGFLNKLSQNDVLVLQNLNKKCD